MTKTRWQRIESTILFYILIGGPIVVALSIIAIMIFVIWSRV